MGRAFPEFQMTTFYLDGINGRRGRKCECRTVRGTRQSQGREAGPRRCGKNGRLRRFCRLSGDNRPGAGFRNYGHIEVDVAHWRQGSAGT
ncbi:MAG: hypothetical protein ACR5LG_00865 [Sodalis sp. (in: enterobacteria)]|uniref:hypothetical protein n=1 Tax=Sodalis sp. (in: enterobacteria) TaxID=1898979 RepID=UPI003F3AB231